ncbi:MAG: hypothetical protein J4F42_13425 [Desulfurellaceae bacterium]|nr:hypothetical protein [Desulfurellaceae bacterium]
MVWDLDQTLWSGVLLEGDVPVLRPGVRTIIEALDRRGILHSIASQGDHALALSALRTLGLEDYFLAPQIDLLRDKAEKIATVAATLNLQLEHLAFIDDSAYQRALVTHSFPAVAVFDARQAVELPSLPGFRVQESTTESRSRRRLYQAELQRQTAQKTWTGSRLDFLQSCQIQIVLRPARRQDVGRIGELLARTHRLNASMSTYSRQTLNGLIDAGAYRVTVAQLSDRFGDQGLVGVLILGQESDQWEIETLLVSCRVMGRGVGETLLVYSMTVTKQQGQEQLWARYQQTAYNRPMSLLFVTHGFRPNPLKDGIVSFRHDLAQIPDYPVWASVRLA